MDFSQSHLRAARRRGVTLLELLVVVTLMGTLSTVVVTRYGRDIFGDIGARSDAQKLWMDLQHARGVAIRNGTVVSVSFEKSSSGQYSGYKITEKFGSRQIDVSELTKFGSDIVVTPTSANVQFTFEGHATSASTIKLKGPSRAWTLTIVPLSGSVRISET
jgi:prepilin-type N-terminal cleavage/methylation domain-containing protein